MRKWKITEKNLDIKDRRGTGHDVIPHFIYIQIMLYSVELKAA